MLERLLPIRPLQVLLRAVCWQPFGLDRRRHDAGRPAVRREPPSGSPAQSPAVHRPGRRHLARGFRYLRLEACDH